MADRIDPRSPDLWIDGDGCRLACYRDGPPIPTPATPTLVFVHGFPDTAAAWDPLIAELSADHRCIRYDVRGAGQSDCPARTRAYRLEHLARDLAAVIDRTRTDRAPVHLVGHDWGAIAGWHAATDPAFADRLASFTSLSGACLDHLGHALRASRPPDFRRLLGLLKRSWYIGLFQLPGVAELGWRYGMAPRWPDTLARIEGQALPVAPTWRRDGVRGIRLYRANIGPRLWRPEDRPAITPVHAIVAQRDPFVRPALIEAARPWVADLRVSEIDARHWAIASRAPQVADLIRTDIARRSGAIAE